MTRQAGACCPGSGCCHGTWGWECTGPARSPRVRRQESSIWEPVAVGPADPAHLSPASTAQRRRGPGGLKSHVASSVGGWSQLSSVQPRKVRQSSAEPPPGRWLNGRSRCAAKPPISGTRLIIATHQTAEPLAGSHTQQRAPVSAPARMGFEAGRLSQRGQRLGSIARPGKRAAHDLRHGK